MNSYDHDQDYALPYHWSMSADDLAGGGTDYWQYVNKALEIIGGLPRGQVLEVGCGDGRIAAEIAARFSEAEVTAVDVSERAIGFAKLLAPRVDFRVADVFTLTGTYEVIVLIEVLEHIAANEVSAFLRKLYGLLADHGSLVLSVPTLQLPRWHPGHVQHFSESTLREALERAGFRVAECAFHLDVRLSRYSRLGRLAIRLFHNRVWTLKPGLALLRRISASHAFPETGRYAGRLIVRATKTTAA